MGKKLNNYVRFPLILGVTCLLCGGALAGVNFITSPIIKENNDKKANQSLDDIIGKGNYTKAETVAADIDSPNILSVKKVTLNSGEEVYYYQLESTKGYSGTVTFAIVYSANGIMGYKFISATEDSLGVGIAKQESKWNESLASYDASKGNFVILAVVLKQQFQLLKLQLILLMLTIWLNKVLLSIHHSLNSVVV